MGAFGQYAPAREEVQPRRERIDDALIHAEQSLISGALQGCPLCLDAVVYQIDPDAFLSPQHRVAVDCITDVVERGATPGLETVLESLLRTGRISDLSAAQLSELTDTPGSLDPEARASEIMAAWRLRQLVRGHEALLRDAHRMTPVEFREAAVELLQDLPSDRAEPCIEAVNPLAVDAMPEPSFANGPRPGTTAVVAGAGGVASKTTFATSLALSGAAHVPVFRTFAPARPLRIQYWNFEDAAPAIREKLHAIFGAVSGLEGPAARALRDGALKFFFPEGPLFAADARGRMAVTPLGKHFTKLVAAERPDHVFLDNLALFAVVTDEDNVTFAWIMAHLSRLAKASGASIWVIHHTNKTGAGHASQNSIRGGSSLVAAARYALTLTPVDADNPLNRLIKLTVVKNSYAQPPAPVVLSRGLGGALREEEKPRFDPAAVAEAVRGWLLKHPEARVKQTGINRRSGDGAMLLSHLLELFPHVGSTDISVAVAEGLKHGVLCVAELTRSASDRHKITVLQPADANRDPD
jgi:hypothetical protein